MNKFFTRLQTMMVEYFSLSGYLVSQEEAEASIREGVSFRGTNMLILILAILIASLGLNTNSTAVIIGAMLISPLMGPIIGIGLGIGIQDFELVRRSLRNLIMAAGFSVIASTIYFLISPVGQNHSELLARTSPTIYDVLIGFIGGGAGILAIGSRSKGNVIPGVAIATALMPPLCTAGYGLATWQLNYFFGAFYLFLINSIFICLATFIGVKLMNYKLVPVTDPDRARRVRRIVLGAAIITLLPSIYLTYNMLRESRFEINAGRFVAEQCRFQSAHVLSSDAQWHHGRGVINITLIGSPMPQDSLQLALGAQLAGYGLQGATLNIVQGSTTMSQAQLEGNSVRDVYELTQAALMQKQSTIDSLQTVITQARQNDDLSASVAPEVHVIFPDISGLAISRSIFAATDSASVDTVNMALVRVAKPMTEATRSELARYLEARLRLKKVEIVEL
ncbi:MAG: TIGR00341 family protein [Muribaculaceae bacterium]|nr:TIGR00341 family protein [Muribaculaceae bacterium]